MGITRPLQNKINIHKGQSAAIAKRKSYPSPLKSAAVGVTVNWDDPDSVNAFASTLTEEQRALISTANKGTQKKDNLLLVRYFEA
jgi:hypothetical protein